MGKSLYAAHALSKGQVLKSADIVMKSPGGGLPPYELQRLLGKRLAVDVRAEQALSINMVE
jgi:N-acetylneuraminate synthase/sialic acid synthase